MSCWSRPLGPQLALCSRKVYHLCSEFGESFFFFFFNGYETNLLVVENGLPELCFRGRVSSTFVINQERNYMWSKEKKSFVMAGRDETVLIHRAVNLPAESNHYCQLNHFRLTWRQKGELSAPLPVRKERFFPPFIGMMNK